uniref:Vacuolar protein 14 C-terminal Fig4-binding domain-containing protein n=2 Tax=Auxenochlorella protothecoides TaxID=3075 RepID=A0A1D1ZXQ0_AUXPR
MIGTEAGMAVLPPAITKNIADKFYDRRKVAALEVEQMVRAQTVAGDREGIADLLDTLAINYALSAKANARKGGLLCLAASAVGMASAPGAHGEVVAEAMMPRLVPPILSSFTDPDARVRYYALEALYNVAKSTRAAFLAAFPDVFDALFRVCADADAGVQNAAAFLNNLVKDIVAEAEQWRLEPFVPQLAACLGVEDPHKRQFLLGWVGLLDSLPGRDLGRHLPDLLPGLLGMLGDPTPEIAHAASRVFAELEADELGGGGGGRGAARRRPEVDAGVAAVMAAALTRACAGEQAGSGGAGLLLGAPLRAASASSGTLVSLTALRWLHGLLLRERASLAAAAAAEDGTGPNGAASPGRPPAQHPLHQQYPVILEAVLLSLGSANPEILAAARALNQLLLEAVGRETPAAPTRTRRRGASVGGDAALSSSAGSPAGAPPPPSLPSADGDPGAPTPPPAIDTPALLASTVGALESSSEAVKLAALQWLPALLRRSFHEVFGALPALLRALVESLGASSAAVAVQALAVLGDVALRPGHSHDVLAGVADAFRGPAGAKLLQRRGVLIVQTLAERLGGLQVLLKLSSLAAEDPDPAFGAALVQALNLLLLVNPSLAGVRALLAQALYDPEAASVFSSLLRAWSRSCAACLSLAFLAQAYGLACSMLEVLAAPAVALRLETMVEACQLVSLLESPAFAGLRLRLLAPAQHPALLHAVHSLLMLLPQGDAFRTLATRLAALPPGGPEGGREAPAAPGGGTSFLQRRASGKGKAAGVAEGGGGAPSSALNEDALLAFFREVQQELAAAAPQPLLSPRARDAW